MRRVFLTMYHRGIFVFGAKASIKATKTNAIFSLPLEITWKIFSYLDDASLRIVAHTHKTWSRIIIANRKLRNRLNMFELSIKLGSENLAKFYKKNKRELRREKKKNYLALGKTTVLSTEIRSMKSKRGADEFVTYTKRFKLF